MSDKERSTAEIQQQKYDHVRWALHNAAVRDNYGGKLVVVHKKSVIVAGDDRGKLLEQAAREGYPRDELVVVEIMSSDFAMPVDGA